MIDINTPPAPERPWIGPVIMLMGGISIGFAPIGLRFGVGDGTTEMLGPLGVAFWRYMFALPLIYLAVRVLGGEEGIGKPNRAVVAAGTFFALDISLWHLSLTLTTVANSTFLVNLGNLLVGLAAWWVLKEKPTQMWVIAVVIAIAGAGFLSLGGSVEGEASLGGDLLAIAAAILVSFYMVFAKVARRTLSGLQALFWLTLTEIIVSGIVTGLSPEPLMPPNMASLQAPLMLAIIVQCLGQGLIIYGLGRTPAAIAGVMVVVQPVTAAILAFMLFKEPLVALQAFGAALILVGVFIAAYSGRSNKPIPVGID